MKRDRLFQQTAARASDFEFTKEVAEIFDDMLLRSVPFYLEQQLLIVELAQIFYQPKTVAYDLGCSTGTTLLHLSRKLKHARLVGYDNSAPMVEKAQARIKAQGLSTHIDIRQGDLQRDLLLSQASVVTLCWTLQFIRPQLRAALLSHIYTSLESGGALIVTEKVLTASTQLNRLFIDRYYEFKKRNGYSNQEIMRKREALENVLIPLCVDENVQLFHQAGFDIVEPFFQWYNFVGFLCIKKSMG